MKNNLIAAIILAGGSGIRFGKQKQFVQFHGLPLWKHVYDKVFSLIPEESYFMCFYMLFNIATCRTGFLGHIFILVQSAIYPYIVPDLVPDFANRGLF